MAAEASDESGAGGAHDAAATAGLEFPTVAGEGVGLGSAYDAAVWVTEDPANVGDAAAHGVAATVSAYAAVDALDSYDAWDDDTSSGVASAPAPPGVSGGPEASLAAGDTAHAPDPELLAWLASVKHRNWSKEFQAVLTKPTETPAQRLDKVVAMYVPPAPYGVACVTVSHASQACRAPRAHLACRALCCHLPAIASWRSFRQCASAWARSSYQKCTCPPPARPFARCRRRWASQAARSTVSVRGCGRASRVTPTPATFVCVSSCLIVHAPPPRRGQPTCSSSLRATRSACTAVMQPRPSPPTMSCDRSALSLAATNPALRFHSWLPWTTLGTACVPCRRCPSVTRPWCTGRRTRGGPSSPAMRS